MGKSPYFFPYFCPVYLSFILRGSHSRGWSNHTQTHTYKDGVRQYCPSLGSALKLTTTKNCRNPFLGDFDDFAKNLYSNQKNHRDSKLLNFPVFFF